MWAMMAGTAKGKQKAEEALIANLENGVDYSTLGLKKTGKRGKPAKDIRCLAVAGVFQ